MFVIQKHRATQLHYDFRLEVDGVLRSWAVPKGPSLDPTVRRLAMQVEDHPVDYAKFEGVIPEGEYGGGTVMVWDYGTYKPEGDLTAEEALAKGDFKFTLEGEKLKGSWVLVRTRNRQWLLIKHRDYYTTTEDVTELAPVSILSRRSLAEIAEDEGGVKRRKKGSKKKVWHSNRAS
jgi:bifunctional non-homologous end joining protein LigD